MAMLAVEKIFDAEARYALPPTAAPLLAFNVSIPIWITRVHWLLENPAARTLSITSQTIF